MSDKTEKSGFDRMLTRKSFLQLTIGTTATLALSPLSQALAAIQVGRCKEHINLAILADLHYYAPELGTTSKEFHNWVESDMKLLADSRNIVASAINSIMQSDTQIVLVPGDLTKDGELLCHRQVASLLEQLTNAGKKVYVINGNHDIYNPNAWSFTSSPPTLVQNIGPSDFRNIYYNFGYKQAIATDPNSLSYVVEPVPNLRIIAMDSCVYNSSNKNISGITVNLNNYPSSITRGSFSDNTLKWIKSQIQDATFKGKAIIGMMHHGIVPHFSVQPTFFPDFVLQNYAQVGQTFSSLGLEVVFTGHFHAQNISQATYGSNTLLDIETGSLVTYPIPIRYVELTPDKNRFKITTSRVTSTASSLSPAWDGKTYANFQNYAKGFLADLIPNLFVQEFAALLTTSTSPVYNSSLSLAQATVMAQQFAQMPVNSGGPNLSQLFTAAMIAHYAGDYKPDAQTQSIYNALATSTDPKYGTYLKILGQFLESVGNMDNPVRLGDNDLNFNLKNVASY